MRAIDGSLLRIVTAGSVDDGKSTLIGRLLYDSKQVFQDQLEHVAEASARRTGVDGDLDLSLLMDGLRAEREQGITIDVAYRHFATSRRAFILADAPGHVRYTRNMVTGASTADLALILIDAHRGIVQQSRRHMFIASLLRIPHVMFCVNKMDLVDYREDVFDQICDEISYFTSRLRLTDVSYIPISALRGDNVVAPSRHMAWYSGGPLLYELEHVQVASDRNLIDVRFPVQWVIRTEPGVHQQHRSYAGQMASGIVRPGEQVMVLPSGDESTVTKIDVYGQALSQAFPPLSVAIQLADDLDISRGDLICRPRNQPTVGRELDAMLCWMSETASRERGRYLVKHTTRTVRGSLDEVVYRIDVNTLHHDEAVRSLALNEIGRVRVRTSSVLMFDSYDRNRTTGAFILIDEKDNETVAAGMILGSATPPPTLRSRDGERSANVRWEPEPLDRETRWQALGVTGATVWLTGLPASGKSTLAGALEERLVHQRIAALRLDGDNLRHGLNGNLGFDPADRAENVRRTAHAARLLAEAGTLAIVSLVSPYAADRQLARTIHEREGLQFIEVFVDTPLDECERRDPKGLYARARAGDLPGFTGVGDAYEPPPDPDLRLPPQDVPTAVLEILAELRRRRVIPRF